MLQPFKYPSNYRKVCPVCKELIDPLCPTVDNTIILHDTNERIVLDANKHHYVIHKTCYSTLSEGALKDLIYTLRNNIDLHAYTYITSKEQPTVNNITTTEKRDHASEELVTFSSGASCSKLEPRYDLICPTGLKRLAFFYGGVASGSIGPIETDMSFTVDVLLEYINAYVYKGSTPLDILAAIAGEAVRLIHNEDDCKCSYETRLRHVYYFSAICPAGLKRLALRYTLGSKKYSDYNWCKGIPKRERLNHLIHHAQMYKLDKNTKDDNLAAIAWNAFALMHYEDNCKHHEAPWIEKTDEKQTEVTK